MQDKKKQAYQSIRLYWDATMDNRRAATLSLALPCSQVLLGVAVPFFASKSIANVIFADTALHYFWLLAASAFLGLLLNHIGIRSNMIMQANAMRYLHQLAYRKLLHRGLGFFNNRIGGKLVSDALDFSSSYGTLVTNAFIKATGFFLTVLIGLIVLLLNSPLFAVIVFVLLAIIATWTVQESKRRSGLRVKRLQAYKDVAAHLSDTIVNAQTVKTFAAEARELDRGDKLSTRLAKIRQKDWVRATSNETWRVSLVVSLQVLLVLAIILAAKDNPQAIASGIFAFTYALTLTNRFFELNTIIRQVEESLLNASSMTSILLEDNEITDKPGSQKLEVTKGSIDIKNVAFRFPDSSNDQYVFKDLSLHIKPGERVGLIGHSGGGKSTLTRLLLRFNDVDAGSISIDGQDIQSITQASLRRAIAYVPQEPLLFHRSIGENISYGKPAASHDEIKSAADRAFASEFIDDLPEGYDTLVGERGVKLSGGQRQRVAIARAILKDAPILILDEATSALDSESERFIQKAFGELMRNKTTIVIAHRLSTIQRLDRIIVLDNGSIVEEGTHEQLLERSGVYAKLWRHQSGGFIEE